MTPSRLKARIRAAALLLAASSALALVPIALAAPSAPAAPAAPAAPRAEASPRSAISPQARDAIAPVPRARGSVTRDGLFWVETVTGNVVTTPFDRFKIEARGSVKVIGGPLREVRYSLVKRVKARTEIEAVRLLAQYRVRVQNDDGLAVLQILHAGDSEQGAELTAEVPASLKDVIIATHGGAVDASDLEGSLKAETGGGRMRLDRLGGRVSALTAGGEISLGQIRGAIRCQSAGGSITADSIGGEAFLETGGGEIIVGDARGPVHASTAGGGIRIDAAGGPVEAATAGGSLEIGRVRGMVTAKNLGGPIRIGEAYGVSAETAGGAIHLERVSGILKASTAVGNVFASLAGARTIQDSVLETGGGDITVIIPARSGITIRAENASAPAMRKIISDFPEITVRTVGPLAIGEGKIYGGGSLLKLSGTGGTIFIKKQKE